MDEKKKKFIKIIGIVLGFTIVLSILTMLLSNSEPKQEELTFWGFWEEEEVMHPLIEKYEIENPGVKITYAVQPLKNYESILYTRLEQAEVSKEPAPDIAMIHNSWTPKFGKYLSPLPQSVMSREEYAKEFYPTALEDFTASNGEIYAIPLQIDGLMIIYNKKLLREAGYDAPPTDWDSFMEAAEKLTKRNSNGKITQAGVAIGSARNITHSTDILFYFYLQNLAPILNKDKTIIDLTSERALNAFDKYCSFANEQNSTWATYLPNDLSYFVDGKLAMMFGTSWRTLEILEYTKDIEFGLAPLPRLTNNDEVYYSTYWGTSVSKTSKNALEAWKFVKFLSEPEQLRRLYQNAAKTRTFGEPYSRVSMNRELAENEYTKALAYMAPFMKSIQVGEQAFVEDELRKAITAVVENGRSNKSTLQTTQDLINARLAVSNKW